MHKKGYDVYKCKKCKNSKFINFVEPLGHDYTKVKVVQEATCTKPEISEFICSRYDDDISHTNPCDGTYSYTKKKKPLPLSGMTGKTTVTEQLPARETAVERPIRISGRKLERLPLLVQIQEKQNIPVPSAVRQRPRQSKRWDINMRLSVPMMQPVLPQNCP